MEIFGTQSLFTQMGADKVVGSTDDEQMEAAAGSLDMDTLRNHDAVQSDDATKLEVPVRV